MKMIAVDLGANMALAHNGFDFVLTDHRTFTGPRAHRAGATLEWLDRRIKEIVEECGPIDAVVYERPFARGFDATRSLWGIAGIIEGLATRNNLACLDLTPATIKKHITGSGAGKKPDMLDAATRLGYIGSNEHEADAFCLLMVAISTASKGSPHCRANSQTRSLSNGSANKKKSAQQKPQHSSKSVPVPGHGERASAKRKRAG